MTPSTGRNPPDMVLALSRNVFSKKTGPEVLKSHQRASGFTKAAEDPVNVGIYTFVAKKRRKGMNSPLEYILVGIVTLAVLVYLVLALLMPEKF